MNQFGKAQQEHLGLCNETQLPRRTVDLESQLRSPDIERGSDKTMKIPQPWLCTSYCGVLLSLQKRSKYMRRRINVRNHVIDRKRASQIQHAIRMKYHNHGGIRELYEVTANKKLMLDESKELWSK